MKGTTSDDSKRWTGLSTVSAAIILLSFLGSVGLHAAGYIDLTALPELVYIVWLTLVAATAYYVFDEESVDSGAEVVTNSDSDGESD